MTEDDTVDAFTAKLNGYATKAKELGKTLDESLIGCEVYGNKTVGSGITTERKQVHKALFGQVLWSKESTMETLHKSTQKTMTIPIRNRNQLLLQTLQSPHQHTITTHLEKLDEEATSSSINEIRKIDFDDTQYDGFKDLTEIYENAREVETENLLFTEEEPRNYKEASTDKKWITAMRLRSKEGKSYLFKSQMKDKFEMSDLGLLAYYLGIEVTQTGGEITIKQTGYINKILKESSMMESNDTKITMDHDWVLCGWSWRKMENSVDATYYRCLIGSLREANQQMALSSCESEFMAATGAACQALWLKRLLSEITSWDEERITLKVDKH
ncbi:zinc finger, CCHC-type containing protein [Tanacetum coccineum]|uniref:Zinc finger, CCHC-type containing protein n=1 Tax=Tanacetum coccineum TaxID=301880 RepID=A0ABQ5AWI6_9ASTR